MGKKDALSKPLFIKELIRRAHQELLESQQERIRSGEPAIFEVEKMTIEVKLRRDPIQGSGGRDRL